MFYTVCVHIPTDYYTLQRLTKEEVEFIAGAYEEQADAFTLSERLIQSKILRILRCSSTKRPTITTKKLMLIQQLRTKVFFRASTYSFCQTAYKDYFLTPQISSSKNLE